MRIFQNIRCYIITIRKVSYTKPYTSKKKTNYISPDFFGHHRSIDMPQSIKIQSNTILFDNKEHFCNKEHTCTYAGCLKIGPLSKNEIFDKYFYIFSCNFQLML